MGRKGEESQVGGKGGGERPGRPGERGRGGQGSQVGGEGEGRGMEAR